MTNHDASDRPAERREAPPAPNGPGTAETRGAPIGIVIDRVSHEDIPEICALYKRVWEAAKADVPPEFLKSVVPTPLEFSSRMEGVTYFVAREGKKLLGVVGCAIADGSCRLVDIAVDGDSRRKGVGSALVTSAIEWAKRNHLNAVWVDALTQFHEMAELLRRLGFQEAGLLHRHYYNRDVSFFERTL